ncbi:MAG: PaaI family thioesterase [Candidatus Eremiobacteraeota bacterium]|nr:PaaI family thioesterase [Candidatus Eremiobacteraeota bacterium]MBC5803962.1 PaaI family thioesterase [Candidatus Eremiobacteraeota bacterium]MBC5822521.1 PaaI family thioesterase [Candidatus Eremiobacteraeota bacterium]
MSDLVKPVDDGFYIGCGRHSEVGLHMEFAAADDDCIESRVTIGRTYQGWRGVVHGGIVGLLLDEAMAYAAGARGIVGVTAHLKMRFRRAVPIDAPLLVRGWVLWQRRNVLGVAATVAGGDGTILATGEGRFVARGTLEPGERLGA